MNLDDARIVVRPRTSWEAVDLGFALVHRFRGPVYSAWWATAGPASALILALTWDRFWLSLLLLWGAVALFDRVPLLVLSRAIFGATPRLGDVIRAQPRLWSGHLLSALTLYRLHPLRAFLLSVPQLERLRGAERRRREHTLCRRGAVEAAICAFTCLLLELVVAFTVVVLLWVLLPRGMKPDLEGLFEILIERGDPSLAVATSMLFRVALVVGMGVVGPARVAAGFALYLNRRVILEGWDVDLAFQRIARRLTEPERSPFGRVGVACAAAPLLIALGGAFQQGGESDPAALAEEILAREEFSTTAEESSWQAPDWLDFELGDGDLGIGGLGAILEPLFWIVAIATLCFLVHLFVKRAGWGGARGQRGERAPPPTHAFGLDVRPQSLPEDVPGAALALLRAGDLAGATGLLYRAAIARLVERDGLEVVRGDTEGDCLARARGFLGESRAGFFARVTLAWQDCAYSREPPSGDEVEALCRGWEAAFGGGVS